MFDIAKSYSVLEEVARREGVPVENVTENIEYAISEAIEKCRRENNQEKMAFWAQIPCVGDTPTPHELLVYLVNKVYAQME